MNVSEGHAPTASSLCGLLHMKRLESRIYGFWLCVCKPMLTLGLVVSRGFSLPFTLVRRTWDASTEPMPSCCPRRKVCSSPIPLYRCLYRIARWCSFANSWQPSFGIRSESLLMHVNYIHGLCSLLYHIFYIWYFVEVLECFHWF
jgi:hypothetical protein